MTPEWYNSVASNILNEFEPSNRLNGDEYGELATTIARALLDAHQRGRREGMEEAAEVVRQQVPSIPVDGPADLIQEAEYFALGHALIAISAKMEEQP